MGMQLSITCSVVHVLRAAAAHVVACVGVLCSQNDGPSGCARTVLGGPLTAPACLTDVSTTVPPPRVQAVQIDRRQLGDRSLRC